MCMHTLNAYTYSKIWAWNLLLPFLYFRISLLYFFLNNRFLFLSFFYYFLLLSFTNFINYSFFIYIFLLIEPCFPLYFPSCFASSVYNILAILTKPVDEPFVPIILLLLYHLIRFNYYLTKLFPFLFDAFLLSHYV